MRKVVMDFSGEVSEFKKFLQGQLPSNVVRIGARTKKKTASAKAAVIKKADVILFPLSVPKDLV